MVLGSVDTEMIYGVSNPVTEVCNKLSERHTQDAVEGQMRRNQRRLPGGDYLNLEMSGINRGPRKGEGGRCKFGIQTEEVAYAATEVRK